MQCAWLDGSGHRLEVSTSGALRALTALTVKLKFLYIMALVNEGL
jgi:hypothetical protein